MASVVVIKDGLHTGADPATPTVGVVTAEDARLSNGASFTRATLGGLPVRTGVLFHGVQTLLTPTATTAPSMTVTVAPLAAVCQKAASEGVYVPTSVGTVVLSIAAAPGANSRIDVVYVMQRDASSVTSPDTVTQAELGVVTGTAGVSPAKPGIPVGAVEVGTVTVAAGATATTGAQATVATTCRWTVPLGVPVPVRNVTERDAVTTSGYLGFTVDRLDLGHTERWDGGWREPGATTFARMHSGNDMDIGGLTWVNMPWSLDGAIRGYPGVLGLGGGGVVISLAGLYRVSLQVLAIQKTGSGSAIAGRVVNTVTGDLICTQWSQGGTSFNISASADVILPAGATLVASVYNTSGIVTIKTDGGLYPTGFTVTRIPG